MEITPEIRLTAACIAGALAAWGASRSVDMKTDEGKGSVVWTFFIIGGFVFFCIEVVLNILLIVGLVVMGLFGIPIAIKVLGSVFTMSRREIGNVYEQNRSLSLPKRRRDYERLADENGNVPDEALRELMRYYGEHGDGRR